MTSAAHQRDPATPAAPAAAAKRLNPRVALLLGIAVLTALSQSGDPESLPSLYSHAYRLFRTEHYLQALATVTTGERRLTTDSDLYWQFRLLRVEILLGQRETPAAQKALNFQLPPASRTPRNLARYRLCQANVAYWQARYADALQSLAQASIAARAAHDFELLAEIEAREGSVETDRHRFPQAAALFHRVLDYGTAHSVPWLINSGAANLGYQFQTSQKCDEAIPFFLRAIEVSHQFGAQESEARNTGNLGVCYYRLGDLDKAILNLQRAESILAATGNRAGRQRWLGSIGNIYMSRLDYASAAAYYQRALAMAREVEDKKSMASWLANLAKLDIVAGDLTSARQMNDECLALASHLDHPAEGPFCTLNTAVIAEKTGDFKQAELILRSLILSSPSDPVTRLGARDHLGIVLYNTGRRAEAETEFRSAIDEVELRRTGLGSDDYKRAWLSNLIGFYEDYVEFLMDKGMTLEALRIADSSRARTMAERLRINQSHISGMDFRKVAAASRSVLLTYSLGANNSWLWIITPTEILPRKLPPKSEIRALVETYDRSIQDRAGPDTPAAQKLYQVLIAPARPYIEKTGRAIIVPDGILYSLNFETLPVPGPNPHYWIEDATISIAPSLGLLSLPAGAADAPRNSLLLIGNPVPPDPEFPNLDYAAAEMADIESTLPHARTVTLHGREANPAAWARSNPRQFDLIHFTAHATASREEPLESAVILSKDGAHDFRLHARDIMKTPLNATLVTISACRGAGTRIYSGEGLVGLAWAFLQSGAHNVIAGLWNVNDESSARIMKSLYANLAQGTTPADALRLAKLDLIHTGGIYKKPWYWGPFQLFTTEARPGPR